MSQLKLISISIGGAFILVFFFVALGLFLSPLWDFLFTAYFIANFWGLPLIIPAIIIYIIVSKYKITKVMIFTALSIAFIILLSFDYYDRLKQPDFNASWILYDVRYQFLWLTIIAAIIYALYKRDRFLFYAELVLAMLAVAPFIISLVFVT